jgi:hypothetical protein
MLFTQWILLIEKALTIVEVHAEQIGAAPPFLRLDYNWGFEVCWLFVN